MEDWLGKLFILLLLNVICLLYLVLLVSSCRLFVLIIGMLSSVS